MSRNSGYPTCRECLSGTFDVDLVLEHDCGHVALRPHFENRCSKCNRPPSDESLKRVSTIYHCQRCDNRFDSLSTEEDRSKRTELKPDVTFPDLPGSGDEVEWLPSWFDPPSRRRKRVVVSLLVVLVLVSGVATPMMATPYMAADEFDQTDAQPAVERTWVEYETIVMFRNDDVQPGYMEEELRAVDQVFIEMSVPVTHGVIAAPSGAEASDADRSTICDYLTRRLAEHPDLFEIAQHGYTHEVRTEFYGASEFGGVPIETQREWLREGTRTVERCVGERPDTFVAPFNTYDDSTVRVLDELNYTTVSGYDWFTREYYGESEYFEAGGLVHVSRGENASAETWSNHTNYEHRDLDEQKATFDEAYENNSVYVHEIHYFTYAKAEQYERLREFIRYVKSKDGVAFMTIGEFGSGVRNGEIERTDDGWRVVETVTEQPEEPDDKPVYGWEFFQTVLREIRP